jgi:hypothetical protein
MDKISDTALISDTGWIAIVIIFVAMAIVAVVYILRNNPGSVDVDVKWPVTNDKTNRSIKIHISPNDTREGIVDLYGSLNDKDYDVLGKFNTSSGRPTSDELAKIENEDSKILGIFVHKNLIRDPSGGDKSYENSRLELAKPGARILLGLGKTLEWSPWTRKTEVIKPKHW